jgi:hypothetical protein
MLTSPLNSWCSVDKAWVKLMERVNVDNGVIQSCYHDETLRSMLPHLQEQVLSLLFLSTPLPRPYQSTLMSNLPPLPHAYCSLRYASGPLAAISKRNAARSHAFTLCQTLRFLRSWDRCGLLGLRLIIGLCFPQCTVLCQGAAQYLYTRATALRYSTVVYFIVLLLLACTEMYSLKVLGFAG